MSTNLSSIGPWDLYAIIAYHEIVAASGGGDVPIDDVVKLAVTVADKMVAARAERHQNMQSRPPDYPGRGER